MLIVNSIAGRKDDNGYKYLPEIGISVQGQDANGAWRQTYELASRFGMSLEVLFTWQAMYGNQAFSGQRLVTGIRNLRLDADAYNACLSNEQISQTLEAAKAEAKVVADAKTDELLGGLQQQGEGARRAVALA